MFKKIPHTYVIVFFLIVLAALSTWFIPAGTYQPVVQANGQTVMEYHQSPQNPQSWQVFSALFNGFERGAGIVVFILIIGGAFWILNQSKAIDVGIFNFLHQIRQLNRFALIRKIGADNLTLVGVMTLFSVFGAVFGMSEETIAFVVILVPLAISMGYDSIVGVCMVFVAAGLGFAGAVLNPFTIGIAQELSGLPMFSGLEYRIVCWITINLIGMTFIMRYARKVKKNPKCSPVYEEDAYWRNRQMEQVPESGVRSTRAAYVTFGVLQLIWIAYAIQFPLTTISVGAAMLPALPLNPVLALGFGVAGWFSLKNGLHSFILNLLWFTILALIVGVMGYQWYIAEISALFLALGMAIGAAMAKSANEITRMFIDGARDILSAALVVGLAAGIIVILEDGKVIHTILHTLSEGMRNMGKIASVGIMYAIQTLINLFIPSGSAKAALTIPIMAPFSDLIQVSRQATVMAFQFGDGFTNMITPTSGVLIGVLGMARIPYGKWVKWIFPLMLILILTGFLLLIPTVTLTLNGF